MRLALLTGVAAAALFAGASGARAEIIYSADPYYAADPYVATAPGYVYSVPAPLPGPGYVVTDPGYRVMAAPRAVLVTPPSRGVINPPMAIAPPAVPAEGIVTTGYSTAPSCYIDFRGFERCY
jgi:hypothetical protein